LKIKGCVIFTATVLVWLLTVPCYALEPHEILVIANRNAAKSIGLAKYYMKSRNIPETNLLQLWMTDKEVCSREEYEKKVIPRVRKYLHEKDPKRRIKCLVTMYGMPLKINPPEMTPAEKKQVENLRKQQKGLSDKLKTLNAKEKAQKQRIQKDMQTLKKQIDEITKTNYRAALDSELALVLRDDYPLSGWIPNPFFLGFKNQNLSKENVLLVSRLDGPSDQIVKRVIDDGLNAEKNGLKGVAYFDARWPRQDQQKDQKPKVDYSFYDKSIYLAADQVKKSKRMQVVVNDKSELFKPDECPEAALYCGWYSLGKYVAAFKWRPGSIGYHIASSECSTLKSQNSQVWCKRMLEEGVAATLGPTSEPYVQAFPIPEIFFATLLDGRLTLAECYALSLPFLSWQMVLIGDPLYRPFMNVTGN
jgi:uncharacterized protein (TIGR03790 family)